MFRLFSPGRGTGRRPVVAVFFLLGAISASWAARIPAIREPLHLSDQALGLALLGPATGAVLAMPATGILLVRRAPRPLVLGAIVPLAAVLPLVTVVDNTAQLFAVLFVWGCSAGVIDVAMNTEAVGVQDRLGRAVMSSFHASYSIGGLIGAALGAVCAWAGVAVGTQLVVVSAVVLVAGLGAAARFHPTMHQPPAGEESAETPTRTGLRWSWGLVALAVMAFASFLAEGAANDWSAVYLHSSLGSSAGLAGAGYTCFAVAMAAGRLSGDRLSERWGPRRLVGSLAAVGAVGWAAALVLAAPWATLVGLVLLGIGLATVVPSVFSQAARLGRAAPAIAVVTVCGYAGMLTGPAAIGALAGAVGLSRALTVEVALVTLIAVLCGVLPTRARR